MLSFTLGCYSDCVPDGAIHTEETVFRTEAPEGYEVEVQWGQAVGEGIIYWYGDFDSGGLWDNWFKNNEYTKLRYVRDGATTKIYVPEGYIAHWWTRRHPLDVEFHNEYEIEGDVSIQLGVDFWRDYYVDWNGYDPDCIESNNCEAWISDWFCNTKKNFNCLLYGFIKPNQLLVNYVNK